MMKSKKTECIAAWHGRWAKRLVSTLGLFIFAAGFFTVPVFGQDNGDVEEMQWPDLPLLTIETVDGQEPTATVVTPPEGCLGTSIISEHVPGRLVITVKGKTVYDSGDYVKGKSGMRMKIRGNNSGAFLPQHPYKLKLSKKADLIGQESDFKSKDWALLSMHTWNKRMLNSESNILLIAGLAVCRFFEFPWVPRTCLVNVVLNGTYRGIYHLTETVERADNRIKTDDSGYVIENDAYWWKEGEAYFKTDRQNTSMGYTFKYPDADDLTDGTKELIAGYMNRVEEKIFSGKGADECIDYGSFARWLLAHDILGSIDVAGSNAYLYKESLDADKPDATLLKMATLWDFDSSFLVDDNAWSSQHVSDIFYYPQLLKDDAFVKAYKQLYKEKASGVYAYVESCLNTLKANSGETFEQSRLMHQQVYHGECVNSLEEQVNDVLAHLKVRLENLQTLVDNMDVETGIGNVSHTSAVTKRVDVYGHDYTRKKTSELPQQLYIERLSDGTVRKYFKK